MTVYVTYIFDHRRRDEAKSVLLRHILLNKQDQEKVTCMIGEIKLTLLLLEVSGRLFHENTKIVIDITTMVTDVLHSSKPNLNITRAYL